MKDLLQQIQSAMTHLRQSGWSVPKMLAVVALAGGWLAVVVATESEPTAAKGRAAAEASEWTVHGTRKAVTTAKEGAEQFRVAYGSALQPDDIETLFCSFQSGNDYSGYYYRDYMFLLLKNGWAYDELLLPPLEFDAEASREAEPQHWKRWRQNGEGYEVQDSEGNWQPLEGSFAQRAPEGDRMNRSVKYMRSNFNAFTGGTTFSYYYQFSADGRFESSSSSLSSSGMGMETATGTSVMSSTTKDSSGETSATSATNSGESAASTSSGFSVTSSRKRPGNGDHSGQYQIDDYSIEFNYDNGKVDRELFAYCDGDRANAFIGNRQYWFEKADAADALDNNWELVVEADDNYHFSPKKLEAGQRYELSVGTRTFKSPPVLQDWLTKLTQADEAKLGSVKETSKPTINTNLLVDVRGYEDSEGRPLVVTNVLAYKVDRGRLLMIKILTTDSDLAAQYQPDVLKVLKRGMN